MKCHLVNNYYLISQPFVCVIKEGSAGVEEIAHNNVFISELTPIEYVRAWGMQEQRTADERALANHYLWRHGKRFLPVDTKKLGRPRISIGKIKRTSLVLSEEIWAIIPKPKAQFIRIAIEEKISKESK